MGCGVSDPPNKNTVFWKKGVKIWAFSWRGLGERRQEKAQTISLNCAGTPSPGKIEYNCHYFNDIRQANTQKKLCKNSFQTLQSTIFHRTLNLSSIKSLQFLGQYGTTILTFKTKRSLPGHWWLPIKILRHIYRIRFWFLPTDQHPGDAGGVTFLASGTNRHRSARCPLWLHSWKHKKEGQLISTQETQEELPSSPLAPTATDPPDAASDSTAESTNKEGQLTRTQEMQEESPSSPLAPTTTARCPLPLHGWKHKQVSATAERVFQRATATEADTWHQGSSLLRHFSAADHSATAEVRGGIGTEGFEKKTLDGLSQIWPFSRRETSTKHQGHQNHRPSWFVWAYSNEKKEYHPGRSLPSFKRGS